MSMPRVSSSHRPAGTGSCGVCYNGILVMLARAPDWAGGYDTDFAFACVCGLGSKHRSVMQPADAVLSREEILELWPEGVPQTAGPITARYQGAGIPPSMWNWTLETYRKKFGKDAAVKRYLPLASAWLDSPLSDRTDIVIYGPNGTGKTGLATTMLLAAIQRGDVGRWVEKDVLMAEWRESFRDGSPRSELDILHSLELLPMLVVDEAAAGNPSEFVESTLTRIIEHRHQRGRPTIFTLNLPAADDKGERYTAEEHSMHLGQVLGPALFDRLRARAQFWPLIGRSKRKALRLLTFPDGRSRIDDTDDED